MVKIVSKTIQVGNQTLDEKDLNLFPSQRLFLRNKERYEQEAKKLKQYSDIGVIAFLHEFTMTIYRLKGQRTTLIFLLVLESAALVYLLVR